MGRKKKEIRLKEPVRIREKVLAGGNVSLYLDIYCQGNRKKEGLKLYLVPEVSAAARIQNANTRKLAEQIKAQRILDIQKEGLVDWEKVKSSRITLDNWFDRFIAEDAELSASSQRSKRNVKARVIEYLNHIGKPNLSVKEVDKEFCKGFIAFLKTCTQKDGAKKLSQTTQRLFINRFGSAMAMAVREGIIDSNPFLLLDKKDKPQKANAEKEFLTIEEIQKAIDTPCRYDMVKKAFLFCCFTGLRYSDMKCLKWSEIHTAPDGVNQYIDHIQVKTKDRVTIPVSEETRRWMPERVDGIDTIFNELKITQETVRVILTEWMGAAGIKKHITFHCSRHTAATLLLTLGASIYVVSKILGHKSVKMTEVYAKIVDKSKIETVNLVNGMFNNIAI